MSTTVASGPKSSWLSCWTPENDGFWCEAGKRRAWTTLVITTLNLVLAFSTWFMVSALVVRLRGVGFALQTEELFWLTAMPGLAGGTFRIAHMFLIPIFGTRHTITWATLSLLIPCIGWGLAVQSPATPYWVLLLLAFLAGLGGGNFSSFMPSTSLYFPKRLQGTALGIQAGIGNFGVSLVQLIVPWIIGFSLFGGLVGGPQTYTAGQQELPMWLQNGTLVWTPLIVAGSAAAWLFLRSVPVRASFAQQTDIFKEKHTWIMTSLYIMTFGSFSGFSATFPLVISSVYGRFEGGPDPLTYAFLGPLVGSAARVLFGPVSDRCGGGKMTMLSGVGLTASALAMTWFTQPQSLAEFPGFVICMLALFLFSGIGNASTFKQIPVIFPPRQAGGVIGWTAAVAAYGPFLFAALFGSILRGGGSPAIFFYGAAAFYLFNTIMNWWFYTRGNAEKPC